MIEEPPLTEKQRRVLEAALEVFAERGFASASTSEIAKRAGVAEGTVYKTYRTKKDLLVAVVAPFFARFIAPTLIDEVREILRTPHASLEEFLRALFTNRVAFIRSHESVVRIAFQELPFHPEVRELAKKTIAERALPDFIAAVERFQMLGEIRPAEPGSIVRLVAGTVFTYVLTRVLLAPDRSFDDGAEIELMVTTLAKGLRP